jgi:hypothetical protein
MKQENRKVQFNLENFVGTTAAGKAVYSNIPGVRLNEDKTRLLDRLLRRLMDFETGEINLKRFDFVPIVQINPEYEREPYISVNEIPHDLVEYHYPFYAKSLLVKEISFESKNSTVKLTMDITESEETDGKIDVSVTGAYEDISQITAEVRGETLVLSNKENWEYAPEDGPYYTSFHRGYYTIVGEIKPAKLTEREVALKIKVPKGTPIENLAEQHATVN